MIFVFDLDGTISFDGKSISLELLESLTELSLKNQLIFASARPIRDMLPLLSAFPKELLIGGNGSIVRNKQQQIEIVQPISAHDFLLIKKIITDQDLDYLIDSDWNYALLNRNEERVQINDKIDQCHLAKNVSLSEIDRAIKCNLLNPQSGIILHELKKLNLEIVRHEEAKSIDLTAKGVNKYTTLRQYFPKEEYIAFGNDDNDVQLLRYAELSIAVGSNQALDFADIHLNEKEILRYLEKIK